MRLRIGSRGSQLALWQANHIAELLRQRGHEIEIEIIHTTGDKVTDVALAKVGSKGMFIKEIEEGMKGVAYSAIPDRREAIRCAVMQAKQGDTILIAGKGHETYQVIGNVSHPFDDRVVAREVLNELNAGRN